MQTEERTVWGAVLCLHRDDREGYDALLDSEAQDWKRLTEVALHLLREQIETYALVLRILRLRERLELSPAPHMTQAEQVERLLQDAIDCLNLEEEIWGAGGLL